ncbi:MAG: HAD-IA family hydrolase [Oscillospiraceae bacterium]|nr:HAD-IA family hydrolase [Oscillospiraceae bacterium]
MRKTVLFDLDGTLLDTLQDITSATNEILSRYGRAACTVAEMRDFVGNGARHQFRSSWKGDISEELLDEALELYRPYYAAHIPDTRPYDGIIELLKGLKADGFRMAVVTNKPVLPTTSLCNKLLGDLVDVVVAESPERPKKPAPDMVEEAMRQLGVTRDDCVYVGDSEVDVATGRNSGMPCYACTWGYRDTDVLLRSGADILVDSAEELGRMLRCGEKSARLMTLLKRRRSVRKFEDRPVEEEKIRALLSAALLAPTSRSLSEVEYRAITDRTVIGFLAQCKEHGAGPLTTAPLALVLTADADKADTWIEDSSLAAIVLQLMAEELGLASCWIQMHLRKDEGDFDAEENVARVLGLPKGRRCVCVLAIGYRAEEKEANREPSLKDLRIHRL